MSKDIGKTQELEIGPITLLLPNEWEIKRFDQILNLINGVNYKSKYYTEDKSGMIFLNLKCVKKGGGFNKEGVKFYDDDIDEEKLLSPGDLLIANTDLTREGAVVGYPFQVPEFKEDKEITASMDLSILKRQSDKINKKYIQYLFRTNYIHSRMKSFSAGSTVLHLNTDLLKSMDLPLPPIKEQQKMASIFYNLDQIIKKTEETIEQTKRVKKGLIQDLFTEGYYDHKGFEEIDDFVWGKVPKEWNFVKLNEIVDVNPRINKPDKKVSYIEMDAVNTDLPNVDYIGKRNPKEYSGRMFKENDTLFARITPCTENGKICFVEELESEVGIGSTEFIVLAPNLDKIDPKYLYYFARNYRVRDYAISRMRGSTGRQRVPVSVFKKEIYIPLPSLDEQKQIVDLLSNINEQLIKELEYKSKLKRIKKGLMQDLLTGKVRTYDEPIEIIKEVID